MKTRPSGISCIRSLMALAFSLSCCAGCQTPNFYYAESMPQSLRLVAQSNPQEVDLTRLASASGGSDTIGPGDVLEVTISASLRKDDQVTIPVSIQDDGTGTMPEIGAIRLAGFEPQAAESMIRLAAINQGLYRNPAVTVAFVHKKVNRVRVLGAVKEPGLYELPPNSSDIVSAIASAQGLAEDAGEKVEVRNPIIAGRTSRPAVVGDPLSPYSAVSDSTPADTVASGSGMRAYTVSLTSASTDAGNRYTVEDGGVIMVEKRDPAPIKVGGLVNKADNYDFPIGKPLTVLGAIQMAGGVSNQLADKVYVIRPLARNGEKARIQVSLRKAKRNARSDILLGPGDMVLVEQTPATVLMEAAQLIRFGISGTTALF